jgi:hypothetical protein
VTQGLRTATIILLALGAAITVLCAFPGIEWFGASGTSGSVTAGISYGPWGLSLSALGFGFFVNWWAWVGLASAAGGSASLGWGAYVMVLAGVACIASAVLAGLAIIPTVKRRGSSAGLMGILAGSCAVLAAILGFTTMFGGFGSLFSVGNSSSTPPFGPGIAYGIILVILGCACSFTGAGLAFASGRAPAPSALAPPTPGYGGPAPGYGAYPYSQAGYGAPSSPAYGRPSYAAPAPPRGPPQGYRAPAPARYPPGPAPATRAPPRPPIQPGRPGVAPPRAPYPPPRAPYPPVRR